MKIYLENILIILMFLKVCYFLRMFRSFAIIIKMITQSIEHLDSFVAFFYMSLMFFSMIMMNSEAKIIDDDYKDYNFNKFFQFFMHTYRSALGDFQMPSTANWRAKF